MIHPWSAYSAWRLDGTGTQDLEGGILSVESVGIPRSLLFHRYGVLWTTFFESLGCRTVVSQPTNRATLTRGAALAVDEACLPLKIHLGHVDALRSRVDHVFVPRFVAPRRDEEACTKLMALTDVIENAMPGTPVIGYTVDARRGLYATPGLLGVGWRLRPNPAALLVAYVRAHSAQRRHEAERVGRQASRFAGANDRPRVLVVGHSYNLEDALIGEPLLKYLTKLGAEVFVSEDADRRRTTRLSARLSKDIYWTYEKELLGAIERHRGDVDGIVFLVAFPCGPNSLVAELVQRKVRDVPLLTLVLDELQGETGLRTRLESFVDILAMKRRARRASA